MRAQEIQINEQKQFEGVGAFPYVFGATIEEVDGADKSASSAEAVEWVKNNKAHIEGILLRHGVILFRGFPVHDATAFDQFVKAFGYENLPYIGGAAPRTQVVGNVYTANESPPDSDIPFHHEMAQAAVYPKKLFFYGDVIAETGGETPICLSHQVYKRMAQQFPEFTEKLERLGVKYTRIMPEETDPSSAQGRGWKDTYALTTKPEVEKFLIDGDRNDFEWLPNGDLKVVSKRPISPVQVDIRTGLKVWFNSIVAVYIGWNDSRHVGPKCVTFGDGTPLDHDGVIGCYNILNEICVNHKWQHGDVIMIDNRIALHARRPFTGPRKIYASLTKE